MPALDPQSVAEFWSWFVANEQNLLESDDPEGEALSELTDRLRNVHEDLVWEIDPAGTMPRQLTISADGLPDALDAVEAICDAAPELPDWEFIRFRPRVPEEVLAGMRIRMNEIELDATTIEVTLYPLEEGVIAIEAFLPGCPADEDPDFTNVFFILLDAAIGEFDVMTKAGPVIVRTFDGQPNEGFDRIPFVAIREAFDELFDRMHAED